VPDARPGHRAPHVWLERNGERGSTLDLFGPRFTLLAGRDGAAWIEAAASVAASLGLDVAARSIGAPGEWSDATGDFARIYGIGERGAVLVRPDGHVAYRERAARSASDARERLESALRRVLAR
jgi:putative polyketide hydroxylase